MEERGVHIDRFLNNPVLIHKEKVPDVIVPQSLTNIEYEEVSQPDQNTNESPILNKILELDAIVAVPQIEVVKPVHRLRMLSDGD